MSKTVSRGWIKDTVLMAVKQHTGVDPFLIHDDDDLTEINCNPYVVLDKITSAVTKRCLVALVATDGNYLIDVDTFRQLFEAVAAILQDKEIVITDADD